MAILNFDETVKQRRAIKHYDPSFIIPKNEIEKLLDLAIQSPTSFNIQNWRFVLVKDQETRQKIKKAAWDQSQVTDASLLFILCADLKSWNKNTAKYWANAPKEIQEMLVPMTKQFYDGKEQLQRDEAMRSIGIVAQTMMLTTKSMGYDSCPMIGFDSQKVAEIINLPKDHIIGMMLVIGKAIKSTWPKPGQIPIKELLFINKF